METLTVEQVLALAPDTASVKAGQGLANPAKWPSLGHAGRSVWGECQGSGKTPYRTQVDLTGPAFHCSCPSRKFPCKHGLGLLLLLAGNPARVREVSPPPWVSEWITKRDASSEKKAAKLEQAAEPVDAETAARREAGREKRASKREDRVRAGMDELQTWLGDLTRQGLAHMKQQPARFYDAMAARMIDAQAPGIARRLRSWPGILSSGDDWAGRVLAEMGALQWLIHGFTRSDVLPEGMGASVRSVIGWTTADADLGNTGTVRDHWQVVGQIVEEEERLRVQRTWLIGRASGRPALCLSFAAMNQPLEVGPIPGTVVDAEMAFYPSASPLRAVMRERYGVPEGVQDVTTQADFSEALEQTAGLFAGDPWLERTPWLVRECVPLLLEESWCLRDRRGDVVPLARGFANGWPLLAISGGCPLVVSGEWTGSALLPLGVFAGDRFLSLGGRVV